MKLPRNLSRQQLYKDVHHALKHWCTVDDKSEDILADLLLVQNKRREARLQTPATRRLSTNQVLIEGLEQLEKQQQTNVGLEQANGRGTLGELFAAKGEWVLATSYYMSTPRIPGRKSCETNTNQRKQDVPLRRNLPQRAAHLKRHILF